jgi:hypothetical protein
LTEAREKAAVPVLIDLLADLPPEKVWPIEAMLNRLAGEQAPNLSVDNKTTGPQARDAWKAWWSENAGKVDLAKLSAAPQLLNFTLVTQMDKGLNGRIYELGPKKEIKWEFTGVRYPISAQVVGRDRVLVCEYLNRRVTERDFKGNVLWEVQVELPIGVQRLPNGDTFIVSRRQLLIVDKDHKEIFTHSPSTPTIAAAQRTRDGQFVLLTSAGQCQRLDAKGHLIKAFNAGPVYTLGGNIEVLANGRILVPQFRDNKVVEYDADGKETWSLPVAAPSSVTRLANGNFLVVSMTQNRVVELTREGREVWEQRTDARPWCARKR